MMENGISYAETILRAVGSDLPEFTDTDYVNEADGLVYCGICKEPKQRIISFPFKGMENKIIRRQCRCDRELYAEEERRRKQMEDREAVKRLRDKSLMDEKAKGSTFASFQENEHNSRPMKICKRYADLFDTMVQSSQGLLFWGPPGTGKTFSAACIANYLLDRKEPVVMTSFVKLIAKLQRPWDGEDEESTIASLNRAKLLIIDDLGAERSTDYALERVYHIIDSRYAAKKPMILTTNMTMNEMQSTKDIRYARIYDRIFEVCYPVEFKGYSWRYVEAERRYDEMQKLLEG